MCVTANPAARKTYCPVGEPNALAWKPLAATVRGLVGTPNCVACQPLAGTLMETAAVGVPKRVCGSPHTAQRAESGVQSL